LSKETGLDETSVDWQRPGIVGVGVVGGAVRNYFELQGIEPLLYDRFASLGSLTEVNDASVVYVCVPTPYVSGRGFDESAVVDALTRLSGEKVVVIKSTVIPGTTERLQRQFPQHHVLFNPEFLREASANQDFIDPDRQIVGYCEGDEALAQAVLQTLPRAPHEAVVPASVAEMTKYATNSFLALKVIFANELFDLCGSLGVDYELVKQGFGVDQRINASHLDVHDAGYRGYGGKCLPKDTMSLLDLADEMGIPMRLLEAAHEVNTRLRAPSLLRRDGGEIEVEAAPERRLVG
jgi:UDPglucose 6-dehydrogenase